MRLGCGRLPYAHFRHREGRLLLVVLLLSRLLLSGLRLWGLRLPERLLCERPLFARLLPGPGLGVRIGVVRHHAPLPFG
ncbi:hypothetical protein BGK70_12620 [Streptomyces agglomeratus]|nr:hypothetical protein BGK70_12620 [Streptomyces agglomeratus]